MKKWAVRSSWRRPDARPLQNLVGVRIDPHPAGVTGLTDVARWEAHSGFVRCPDFATLGASVRAGRRNEFALSIRVCAFGHGYSLLTQIPSSRVLSAARCRQ